MSSSLGPQGFVWYHIMVYWFKCSINVISQMSQVVSSYGLCTSVHHHKTWPVSTLHVD